MATEAQAIKPGTTGDIAQQKIKFGEKFAYALSCFATTPLMTLTTTYLMIFYTDIVGLNPIALGTLFLISRIVDAISDPLMGYLIDRLPRTRMGKYRPVLIVGSILTGLNYLLVWFGPVWSTTGKLAIAYLTYLGLGITFDLMDISRNSFLPVMTANQKERNSLGAINGFTMLFSGALLSIAAPLILSAGHQSLQSYSILVVITVAVVILTSVVGALGVKERVKPVEEGTKYTIKDYLKIFIQRPVFSYLIFNMLYSTAYAVVGGVSAYFFTYVMKNLAMMSTVSMVQLLGLLPGIFISGIIVTKFGKKRLWVVIGILMALASLIRWIDPTSVTLIYVSTVLGGFFMGVFIPTGQTLVADNIDYIEYKLNYRSEAAQTSIMSSITKIGSGLGGAIPGYFLGIAGYVAGSQQQPASAINAMILLAIGVPVVFYIIAAVLFGLGYNVDTSLLKQVEMALSERRARKSSVNN